MSSFPLKMWHLKHHSSDCQEVKVLYEMLQLPDYCAKPPQQLFVNNKKLTPLYYEIVDIHQIFMEAFVYRLWYLSWKVGGAASLKRTDLSFITSSASLEYFSSTVDHISDVFSLMLIQVTWLLLHPWVSLSLSNYTTHMKGKWVQNAFEISRDIGLYNPINLNGSWPPSSSENARLPLDLVMREKTSYLEM